MRVLVAEDEAAIAELLRLAFEEEGDQVAIAVNGDQALAIILDPSPPDVVLLDLLMPVRDGFSVLREMRYLSAHPPVVVMTALTDLNDLSYANALGAVATITKPFQVENVVTTVHKAVPRATWSR